jgi:ribosomal protein S18 acetylase RimI-like enzyme
MDYQMVKLTELSDELVDQAVSIMVDGLFDILSSLSKDKNVLRELFKESLYDDLNFACTHNGDVVGFLGLATCERRAAGNMKLETFERLLDPRAAKIIYRFAAPGFSKPNAQSDKEIEIDFLVAAPSYRGKGVGTHMIEFACSNPQYESCILNYFTSNKKAAGFYESLGFKKIKSKSILALRLRGLGKVMTVRLDIKEFLEARHVEGSL